jgi:hypothetical protein
MTPRSAAAVANSQLAAVHNSKEPCALAVAVPQKMARLLLGKSIMIVPLPATVATGSKGVDEQ